jgi:hypothetical protein
MGTHVSKASKVLTADGDYIPYSAIDNITKQFIALKTKSINAKNNKGSQEPHYAKVGSTVVSSVTAAAASNKFVKLRAFYLLYEKLKTKIDTPEQLLQIVDILNKLQVEEKGAVIDAFTDVFNFNQSDVSIYGNIDNSILLKSTTDVPFIPNELANQISSISTQSGFTSPEPAKNSSGGSSAGTSAAKEATPGTVIPLAEMISHLVAKPLLASQPDIDEVRIHCFSFNSACGLLSEENIGNFPIVKSKFIQYLLCIFIIV